MYLLAQVYRLCCLKNSIWPILTSKCFNGVFKYVHMCEKLQNSASCLDYGSWMSSSDYLAVKQLSLAQSYSRIFIPLEDVYK